MAVSAVKKEPAKPQAAPAGAPAATAPEAAPPKKKGKLPVLVAAAVLVLAGGGGGAWWYLNKGKGGDGQETAKVEPEKPPVFAPLDNFTVNLQQDDVSQFAQVGLTLRMSDEAAVAQLKLRMPEVRDRILLMLSVRKPSELLTLEGKRKLADEIQAAVNDILAPELTKKAAAEAKRAAQAEAKRVAAATQKPAPAPAPAPAEGQEAAAEQGENAQATAEAEAPAEAAPAVQKVVLPVMSVLFTSFIVQ